MTKKLYYIYILTRNDGQKYIGTTNSEQFKIRMRNHGNSERFNKHFFCIEILEESEDVRIHDKEVEYIKQYNTYNNGLNKSWSGKGYGHDSPNFTTLGYKFTDAQRKNISDNHSCRGKFGKDNPSYGKHYSPEICRKLSEIRKGVPNLHMRKLTDKQIIEIIKIYQTKPYMNGVGGRMANGRDMSYETNFAKYHCVQYNVTHQLIRQIITGKSQRANQCLKNNRV